MVYGGTPPVHMVRMRARGEHGMSSTARLWCAQLEPAATQDVMGAQGRAGSPPRRGYQSWPFPTDWHA
eukprot:13365696-Alexandrium_andersonii.AAC.1